MIGGWFVGVKSSWLLSWFGQENTVGRVEVGYENEFPVDADLCVGAGHVVVWAGHVDQSR